MTYDTNAADPITAALERDGTATFAWDELQEEFYHGRPELAVSQLKLLPDQPELFYGRHVAKWPDWQMEPTASMDLGTAVHEALLLDRLPQVIPDEVLSKSGARSGKAWYEFAAAHRGETWLRQKDADQVRRIVDGCKATPKAAALLAFEGLPEHSLFWHENNTGLACRGRLDKLLPDVQLIVDLKTANDSSPERWPWHAIDLGYHLQAASYCEAAKACYGFDEVAFVFIVVESDVPYRTFTYQCNEDFLTLGFTRWQEALHDYQDRMRDNCWVREDRTRILKLSPPRKAAF